MPETLYVVTYGRGCCYGTTDTERAARLSRAGLRVTASMGDR